MYLSLKHRGTDWPVPTFWAAGSWGQECSIAWRGACNLTSVGQGGGPGGRVTAAAGDSESHHLTQRLPIEAELHHARSDCQDKPYMRGLELLYTWQSLQMQEAKVNLCALDTDVVSTTDNVGTPSRWSRPRLLGHQAKLWSLPSGAL